MIGKRTAIWKREEYSYESEERDIPYVISYMHEDGQIRPAMIVVPGGAYRQVSSSEGDIVARTFYRAGYNVLVLTYSVNPTSEGEPLHLLNVKPVQGGYLMEYNYAGRSWPTRQYLYPIPEVVIQFNTNLSQNPGW